MAGEKQIEGNEAQAKGPRSVCGLHRKDSLQSIRRRAESGPFSGIVFSHEAIRRRPRFERGIFRALHGDNCPSPTRISLKCWNQAGDAQRVLFCRIPCVRNWNFYGNLFSRPRARKRRKSKRPRVATPRLKVIYQRGEKSSPAVEEVANQLPR